MFSTFEKYLKLLVLLPFVCGGAWVCAQEASDSTKTGGSGAIVHADSSVEHLPVFYYSMSQNFPFAKLTHELDTGICGLQNRERLRASADIYTTFSVIGQAHQSLNFKPQISGSFTAKNMPYPAYQLTADNLELVNVDKVYTMLRYEWGNGQENTFDVEHAQRIGNFSYNANLQTRIAEGIFVNEGVRDINLGFIGHRWADTLRYGFNITFIHNMFHLEENSGIANNADYESDLDERAIEVNTPNAYNRYHQQHFGYRHWLRLGNRKDSTGKFLPSHLGYLMHQVDWKQYKTVYTDESPSATLYPQFYFDNSLTHDSSCCQQLQNQLFWSNVAPTIQPVFKWKIAVGLSHEYAHCYDTMNHFRTQIWSAKAHATIPLGRGLGRSYWINRMRYAFSGYNANDWDLQSLYVLPFMKEVGKNLIDSGQFKACNGTGQFYTYKYNYKSIGKFTAQIRYSNYAPAYFFSHYQSNYAAWDNDLKKQRMLQASLGLDLFPCELKLHSYFIDNYTLLTDNGVTQLSDKVQIWQGELSYPLRWRGFGMDLKAFVQHSSHDDVHLPDFVTRDAIFYGFPLFHNALYLQFGGEFMYFTAYYANGYRPDMQQFYSQNSDLVGNDFYINAFINARIQHFQVSASATNLLTAFDGFYPYQMPHYPAKNFGFRVGVSWRFYD